MPPTRMDLAPGFYWARRCSDGVLTIVEIADGPDGALCRFMSNLNATPLARASAQFEFLQRVEPPASARTEARSAFRRRKIR